MVLTTSTGKVTATEKQVDLAVEYEANAILTTGDYLLRIAEVARERGYDLGTDLKITALTNLGDKDTLEATFGLPFYRSYGFHEVQWVAQECPARDGLHIYEDAFVVQIVDPETGEELPDGQTGRDGHHRAVQDRQPAVPLQQHGPVVPLPARAVRLRQLAAAHRPVRRAGRQHGQAARHQRLARSGRRARLAVDGVTTDYFVQADSRRQPRRDAAVGRRRGRPAAASRSWPTRWLEALADVLGIAIEVASCGPASSTALTEIETSPKPKRFKDERG